MTSSMSLLRKEKLQLAELLQEKVRRRADRSFASFVRAAWHVIEPHNPFIPGWHIDAICEHLEAVVRGEIRNLIINVPPRHCKSSLVSVLFPAWVWRHRPGVKWLYASHAYSLSKRDSVKCRRLIESSWYRNSLDVKWDLSADQNEKMRFDNTEGGSRIATSVQGAVVGEGGDYCLVDDAHSPMEIYSEEVRKGVLAWYDEEFSSRVNDPKTARRIIIAQRLHEDDICGHLLERGGWEHLCLPAEFEEPRKPTSIGWTDPRKEPGELLWPARFGREEIAVLKRDLGTRAAAGQLQQRPAPIEGEVIRRSWWKFWKELPQMDEVVQSWDLTFKDTELTDFVVCEVWGRHGADKYLLDMLRARMSFTKTLASFEAMCQKWPTARTKLVEEAANGAALIDTLRRKIPGIIPIKPRGSKLMRAQSVSPQAESGNLYLPDPLTNPWVQDFIEEWAMFPNGRHDDQVDAATQAITRLSQSLQMNFKPVSITGQSKWVK
jgi:predicted phage terminase large subunit-like protein